MGVSSYLGADDESHTPGRFVDGKRFTRHRWQWCGEGAWLLRICRAREDSAVCLLSAF